MSTPPQLPPHSFPPPQGQPQGQSQGQPQGQFQPPFASLAYAPPDLRTAHPGGLTAIGVISIILGLLMVIGLLYSGKGMYELYLATTPPPQMTKPAAPLPTPAPAEAITPHDGDFIGKHGLKREARQAFIDAVAKKATVSSDRREMLHRLLADAGADAIPGAEKGLTRAAAEEAVVSAELVAGEARQMRIGGSIGSSPRGQAQRVAVPSGSHVVSLPARVLVVKTGKGVITVGDATALFEAPAYLAAVDHQLFVDSRGTRAWSSFAINEALNEAKLEQGPGMQMNAVQAGLIAGKARASLPPVQANSWARGIKPFTVEGTPGAGTLVVRTGGPSGSDRPYWVLADGRTCGLTLEDQFTHDPATGLQKVGASMAAATPNYLRINQTPIVLLLVETLASGALAAVLVVAGLMAFGQNPGTRSLHRFFACAKLLITAMGIAAAVWLMAEARNEIRGFNSAGFIRAMKFAIMIHAGYPLVVLGFFNRRNVNEYLNGAEGYSPRPARVLGTGARMFCVLTALAGLAAAAGQGWLIWKIKQPDVLSSVLLHLAGLAAAGGVFWVCLRWAVTPRAARVTSPEGQAVMDYRRFRDAA